MLEGFFAMAADDAKSFLYGFLGKHKLGTPDYNVRPTGPKHRQRFLCELRVSGINYTACGNSTVKKDAQTNAAKDFIAYLVRQGQLSTADVPKAANVPDSGGSSSSSDASMSDRKPVVQSGFGPGSLGEAYVPAGGHGSGGGGGSSDSNSSFNRHFLDEEANKRRVEEAEDVDVNAAMHGNWTMDCAKSMLHQWMQSNKVKADYTYSPVGPDHQKSFFAEMSFYVKDLKRQIRARESGSNKQMASKSCALSLVRQLYHFGVIGAYMGTLKKNKDIDSLPPYKVAISPQLQTQIEGCLSAAGLAAVDANSAAVREGETLSLLTDNAMVEEGDDEGEEIGGVVSWCPPTQNWNPWMGCNIDEGFYSTATLDQISKELYNEWSNRQKSDSALQRSNAARASLPIYAMKADIMNTIHQNQVVLIRGNTGCGKTTQV